MRFMQSTIATVLMLSAALPAQEPIPVEDIPKSGDLTEIQWSVDRQGRTWMTPAPSKASDTGRQLLFGDLDSQSSFATEFAQSGGSLGWGMLVCPGPSDLLSLTDAHQHFRCMGYATDEASLVQRIDARAEGDTAELTHRTRLERILAIRIAQRDALVGAAPVLGRIASDATEDRFVRRAAAEAHATLTGAQAPAWSESLQPLDEIFAAMPAGIETLGVVHYDAMPDSHALAPLGRGLGIEVTRRAIREAGGTCSRSQLAGAMRLAMVPGAAPFEATRVLGLQNPRRIVSGFREEGRDQGLLIAEGMFSPEPLSKLLDLERIDYRIEDGELYAELPGNATLTISETRIELRIGSFDPGGDAVATELGGAGPDATDGYWMWLRDVKALPLDQIPMELPILENLEGSAELKLLSGHTLAKLRVHYETEKAAKIAANGIRQVPGLVAPVLAGEAGLPQDMVNELVRGFSAEHDGTAVTVALEHDLLFPELIAEFAKAASER